MLTRQTVGFLYRIAGCCGVDHGHPVPVQPDKWCCHPILPAAFTVILEDVLGRKLRLALLTAAYKELPALNVSHRTEQGPF